MKDKAQAANTIKSQTTVTNNTKSAAQVQQKSQGKDDAKAKNAVVDSKVADYVAERVKVDAAAADARAKQAAKRVQELKAKEAASKK